MGHVILLFQKRLMLRKRGATKGVCCGKVCSKFPYFHSCPSEVFSSL